LILFVIKFGKDITVAYNLILGIFHTRTVSDHNRRSSVSTTYLHRVSTSIACEHRLGVHVQLVHVLVNPRNRDQLLIQENPTGQ